MQGFPQFPTGMIHKIPSVGLSGLINPVSQGMEIKKRGFIYCKFLLIGGGGAGGNNTDSLGFGAGGGAGGLIQGLIPVYPGASPIVIGAGGTPGAPGTGNGKNSTAFGLTAYGGGQGDRGNLPSASNKGDYGFPGGSGGGGTLNYGSTVGEYGGLGYQGQGYNGGTGVTVSNGTGSSPGCGGGAGGPAVSSNGLSGGSPGPGVVSTITGTAVTYGAGGGGTSGAAGTANTGNGGSGSNKGTPGGAGGSGVCIISYPKGSMIATGGTITSYVDASGITWMVHTFKANDTLVRTY